MTGVIKRKPVEGESDTYGRRELALRTKFYAGGSDPRYIVDGIQAVSDGLATWPNDGVQAQAVVTVSPNDGPYADEEVASTYGYPEAYKLKGAAEYLALWKDRVPKLDGSHVERLASTMVIQAPADKPAMDGVFVWPKMSKVAGIAKKSAWPEFNRAMQWILDVVASERTDFVDVTEGKIGPEHLQLHWKTAGALSMLEARTSGDFLVLPIQTGIWHRGKSVRRSRVRFIWDEFGLESYAVGCVALLHPERFTQDSLWTDCAGAGYSPDADGQFFDSPLWHFRDTRLGFGWGGVVRHNVSCGSASARLPECMLDPSTP